MQPLISAVQVATVGGHDRVRVWVRGVFAGELHVPSGDGALLATRLSEPAKGPPRCRCGEALVALYKGGYPIADGCPRCGDAWLGITRPAGMARADYTLFKAASTAEERAALVGRVRDAADELLLPTCDVCGVRHQGRCVESKR